MACYIDVDGGYIFKEKLALRPHQLWAIQDFTTSLVTERWWLESDLFYSCLSLHMGKRTSNTRAHVSFTSTYHIYIYITFMWGTSVSGPEGTRIRIGHRAFCWDNPLWRVTRLAGLRIRSSLVLIRFWPWSWVLVCQHHICARLFQQSDKRLWFVTFGKTPLHATHSLEFI